MRQKPTNESLKLRKSKRLEVHEKGQKLNGKLNGKARAKKSNKTHTGKINQKSSSRGVSACPTNLTKEASEFSEGGQKGNYCEMTLECKTVQEGKLSEWDKWPFSSSCSPLAQSQSRADQKKSQSISSAPLGPPSPNLQLHTYQSPPRLIISNIAQQNSDNLLDGCARKANVESLASRYLSTKCKSNLPSPWKRSTITWYQESFFCNKANWQTELTCESEDELDEYDEVVNLEQIGHGKQSLSLTLNDQTVRSVASKAEDDSEYEPLESCFELLQQSQDLVVKKNKMDEQGIDNLSGFGERVSENATKVEHQYNGPTLTEAGSLLAAIKVVDHDSRVAHVLKPSQEEDRALINDLETTRANSAKEPGTAASKQRSLLSCYSLFPLESTCSPGRFGSQNLVSPKEAKNEPPMSQKRKANAGSAKRQGVRPLKERKSISFSVARPSQKVGSVTKYSSNKKKELQIDKVNKPFTFVPHWPTAPSMNSSSSFSHSLTNASATNTIRSSSSAGFSSSLNLDSQRGLIVLSERSQTSSLLAPPRFILNCPSGNGANNCSANSKPIRASSKSVLFGCANLKIDGVKFALKRNLVATLIGAYILISLCILIGLMLPSWFSLQNQKKDFRSEFRSEFLANLDSMNFHQSQPPVQDVAFTGQQYGMSDASRQGARMEALEKLGLQNKMRDTNTTEHDRSVFPSAEGKQNEKQRREVEMFQDRWNTALKHQCQPLKIPFCSRTIQSMLPTGPSASNVGHIISGSYVPSDNVQLAYDRTLLPNQFTPKRQAQVERMLEKFEPLVDVRCYSLMPLFLCSFFAPKCVQMKTDEFSSSALPLTNVSGSQQSVQPIPTKSKPTLSKTTLLDDTPIDNNSILQMTATSGITQIQANRTRMSSDASFVRLVPPCRSFCREAIRKCSFFLEVLSLQLFKLEDCDRFPDSDDENICLGRREHLMLQRAFDNQKCRNDEFRCNDGECIAKKWRCDGFGDCIDKSDEQKCSKCDSLTQFYCGADICIDKSQVCNGQVDCWDGRDERLCLRLSPLTHLQSDSSVLHLPTVKLDGNNETQTLATEDDEPRRLETWNSTSSNWVPVCGAFWRATPMSHEACQVLGYSRANATLILFDTTNSNQTTFRSGASGKPPIILHNKVANLQRNSLRVPIKSLQSTFKFDHQVTYARQILAMDPAAVSPQLLQTNALPKETSAYDPNQNQDDIKWSLSSLLSANPQAGCELHSSSVHLTCHSFQCGRSVTSYLTRMSYPASFIADPSSAADQFSVVGSSASGRFAGVNKFRQTSRIETNDEDENESLLKEDLNAEESNGEDELHWARLQHDGLASTTATTPERFRKPLAGGRVNSRFVVGGTESMPGEFPYLAALHGGPDEVFFCGGVLISAQWLLTAAHCVGNRTQPDGWTVKVGVTRRIASPAFVKKLRIKRIIKHQLFNQGTQLNNDIALILLDQLVDFNQYLRPICLPEANLKLGPDNSKDCVVVGFGKSRFSQDANYMSVAHFANVPIIHQSVCSNWYAEQGVTLSKGMLCAGYSDGKRDACQGDSGSGLFCRHPNTNQFFVAGLVSFGIKCATPKLPGVYTAVPLYVDWIKEIAQVSGSPIY